MLKGLKSVDLKIIQMYHFGLNGKDIRYAQIGGTQLFRVGLPLFPVGLLLFARWES